MTRYKKQHYISKYEDEIIYLTGKKILKIEEQNTEINNKMKTVFFIESATKPEGRMCITWGRTNFQTGDVVDMKGRIKDDIFLVWSLMFKRIEEKAQWTKF